MKLLADAGITVIVICVFATTLYAINKSAASAGQVILRINRPRLLFWSFVLLAFGLLSLGGWLTQMTQHYRERRDLNFVLGSLLSSFPSFGLFLLFPMVSLWNRHLVVCENGLLILSMFWPWQKVQAFEWNDAGPTLQLKLYGLGWRNYRADPLQKEAAIKALADRLGMKQPAKPT
jgi:hypothetical protein